jgi:hypothetical protein
VGGEGVGDGLSAWLRTLSPLCQHTHSPHLHQRQLPLLPQERDKEVQLGQGLRLRVRHAVTLRANRLHQQRLRLGAHAPRLQQLLADGRGVHGSLPTRPLLAVAGGAAGGPH